MARRWDGNAGKVPETVVSKKPVDLRALLKWAYFDELPKAEIRRAKPLHEFRERWASVADFGDYMASAERRSCNLWGYSQRLDRWGEPHEDALAVQRAVNKLDSQIAGLPEKWDPFSDFPDSGLEGADMRAQVYSMIKVNNRKGRLKLRFKPSALVFNYTILGGCPAWEVKAAEALTLKDLSHGQAIALGLNRAEYEIWRLSLELLAASLPALLVKHVLLPALPPDKPWEAGVAAKIRILPVLNEPFVDLTTSSRA